MRPAVCRPLILKIHMNSVFDLAFQQSDLNSKIIIALERLAEVIRILLWEHGKAASLSPIQIQFLIFLHYHPAEQRRVSELARRFNLTKATVSDAVSTLEVKGLILKNESPQDRRAAVLELTAAGGQAVQQLEKWAEGLHGILADFPAEEKTSGYRMLLQLIEALEQARIISRNRMCLSCRFFREAVSFGENFPYFCAFLDKSLSTADLRVDCPEYEASTEK